MIEDEYLAIHPSDISNMRWVDPLNCDCKIYGLPWLNENKNYERLPISLSSEIKNASERCYAIGKHSTGAQLHFITNSKKLVLHAIVPNYSQLSGMTTVAQVGFDCYVGHNYDDLLFYDTTRFNLALKEFEYTLFDNLSSEDKLVVINFPLYNEVKNIRIAIDFDATIRKPTQDISKNNKWVIYGTSITQGGCCSRPGLNYTNILSRRFKSEFINLGFSGNAFGENIFSEIMSSIPDVTMYFINYEANGGTNGKMEKTLPSFIETIRKNHPITPIVIVSRIKYLFDDLNKDTLGVRRNELRLYQKNLVKSLSKKDNHIYYINGSTLLGKKYDEFTIDSIHPNDIGFWMIAKGMEKNIKKILKREVQLDGKIN